jgi:DNA-binding NtrC family response regulator
MPDNRIERPNVALYSPDGHMRNLRQIEGDLIRLALVHYHGNVSEIARNLDIGRSTLYRKLDELGIGTS